MSEESVVKTIERADVAVSAEAGKLRHTPAVKLLGALSEIADQPPAFTLATAATVAGFVTGRPRLAESGLRALAVLTLVTAAKSAIKSVVVRTRPFMLLDHGHYETGVMGPDEGPWNSFPSGHTANAAAVARAISRVVPEAGGPLAAGAIAIGVTQVPRAAHHSLDVVAGAALGLAIEGAVHALWPDRASEAVAEAADRVNTAVAVAVVSQGV